MNWKLPNQLTVGRIGLAVAFFVLLGLYDSTSPSGRWLLNAGFVIYLVAGISDILDGYLARKMKLVSAFGRIVDPFVDKVLVVGAFIMLAGQNFAMAPGSGGYERTLPQWMTGGMASAVQTWMVVVILAREFIVSAMRGYSESQGITFAATPAGKIKMFVQSVAICTVLYQLANLSDPAPKWAIWVKLACVWASVVATVLSGLAYVGRSKALLGAES